MEQNKKKVVAACWWALDGDMAPTVQATPVG